MTTTPTFDAQQLLREVLVLGPQQITELRRAVHQNTSEMRQAWRDLVERVDAGQANEDEVRLCGVLSYLLAEHETAERCFQRLPNDALARYYLGRCYLSLGRYQEAFEQFQAAAERGWDQVDCTFQQAAAVRLMGRVDEAEQLVRSTGSAGATRAEYCYQMGCILADRCDALGAIEYLERAVDMDPRHSEALFRLANLYAIYGDDQAAIELYERCLSIPPYHLGALVNLGLLYEEVDNIPAATFCFRRVLRYDPNNERARLYLRDIEEGEEPVVDEEELRRQRELEAVLQTPITNFELSARSRNCLERAGIRTIGDLTRTTEQALLNTKNFGETSLKEVRQMMEGLGLKIGQFLKPASTGVGARGVSEISPEQRRLLEMPVADLQLSVRARKCLTRLGINTVGELINKTADELLAVRNFGVTSLNEVRGKLAELGLSLKNE